MKTFTKLAVCVLCSVLIASCNVVSETASNPVSENTETSETTTASETSVTTSASTEDMKVTQDVMDIVEEKLQVTESFRDLMDGKALPVLDDNGNAIYYDPDAEYPQEWVAVETEYSSIESMNTFLNENYYSAGSNYEYYSFAIGEYFKEKDGYLFQYSPDGKVKIVTYYLPYTLFVKSISDSHISVTMDAYYGSGVRLYRTTNAYMELEKEDNQWKISRFGFGTE